MAAFAAHPRLQGRAWVGVPVGAVAIGGPETGYVTHIDVPALVTLAKQCGLVVHVDALPGTMVHPARDLIHVEGKLDEKIRAALIGAFSIERHRSFDQDPRLGLIALSEIASRALAPATNDPGTAIEVLNALMRVFLTLTVDPARQAETEDAGPVHLRRPTIDDMLTDAFGPILREGCNEVEVSLRLTNTLAALHANLPVLRGPVAQWAARHAGQAAKVLTDPHDRAVFADVYARLWTTER